MDITNTTQTQHKHNTNITQNNKDELNKLIHLVVNYLNLKTSKNFKSESKNTRKHIVARAKEDYTFDDFKKVIDIKTAEWINNKEMSKYLRPDTLFGTKFESYLNQNCELKNKEQEEDINEYIEMSRRFENNAK